jgi:hypothetical protein
MHLTFHTAVTHAPVHVMLVFAAGVLVPGAAPSPSRHLLQAPPAQRSPGWARRLINYTATEAGRLSAAADINAAPFNSHSFGTFVAAARWTGTQIQATAGGLQLQVSPGKGRGLSIVRDNILRLGACTAAAVLSAVVCAPQQSLVHSQQGQAAVQPM